MQTSNFVRVVNLVAACAALISCAPKSDATLLTIATVNNGDMMIMKKLAPAFEREHPGVHLKWVVLEENVLRQRVTTDIAAGAGQFDIVTIGNYEVPFWAKQGWLKPVADLPPNYDIDDLLKPVRRAVTYHNAIYALPFYAESAMSYYRSDLFAKAGLQMPDHPTYEQIAVFADKLNDREHQIYGICLRGKPGWGENMATVTSLVHAFGGRWFDSNWHAALNTPQWHRAITYYSDLVKNDGPPGATSNGFNENLVLFASGHCSVWIDSTVAAALLYDSKQSQVVGKVNYAPMPTGADPSAPTWLWSWNLAIPVSSKNSQGAEQFIAWATSKDYIQLVAKSEGWIAVPPGTRKSTYDTADYRQAAPFADFVLNAINSAIPDGIGVVERPYSGAQFAAIPEFQGIGTQVGQAIAATLSGASTVDAALKQAQTSTEQTMQQAGYLK